MTVIGTVYLLCFADHGIRRDAKVDVRHYLGWTAGNPTDRLATHLAGRGSPLIKAVVDRHGPDAITLVRTWPGADRHYERRLKRRNNTPRLCPACAGTQAIHTNPPIRPLKRIAAGHWQARGGLITFRRDGRRWVTLLRADIGALVPMNTTHRTLGDAIAALT